MNKQKQTEQAAYQARIQAHMPKSPILKHMVLAYVVGGAICTLGQAVNAAASTWLGLDKDGASAFTAIAMVFLGALLTGLGLYDQLGKHAGAGSIVPITGFANSIVSPAMEFKREGFVMGVGAKMFVIAGPVLVYGICASVLVGLIAWMIG